MRFLSLALLLPASAFAALPSVTPKAVVSDELMVRFKPNTVAAAAKNPQAVGSTTIGGDSFAALQLKSNMGLVRMSTVLNGRIERLKVPGYMRIEDAITALKADPNVLWAEPNYRRHKFSITPNDPRFNEQWALRNTGQADSNGLVGVSGADLNMINAWDADNNGSPDRVGNSSFKLAILDDGFQLNHPDLAANFTNGFDFKSNGSDNNPASDNSDESHGTLVAGAAGAVGNNGIGISGVAWNLKMVPIKFAYTTETEIRAMEYIRDQGIKVVNMSFGGPEFSNAELDALNDLANNDVLVVAAAGNLDSNNDLALAAYPANYAVSNIVSVAATDRRDQLADFSQYGPVQVDVAAPGSRVLTTGLGGTYQTVSGTSFSAPYTAGVASLLRIAYPAANHKEIRARLIEGAAAGSNLQKFTVGGRVDADKSLDLSGRPSVVIKSYSFDDSRVGDGDGALDAGESGDVLVTVENLWQASGSLIAQLSTSSTAVSVSNSSQTIGALANGGSATLRFPITVANRTGQHNLIDYSLAISGGGYSTTRHFNQTMAQLVRGVTANQTLQKDALDEFHTWHFNLSSLPAGHNRLVVTTSAGADIDVLVKRGAPAQYQISLATDPDGGGQTFYSDIASCAIGGEVSGNERVLFDDPALGDYYVTVINYDQLANTNYSLTFSTDSGARTQSGACDRSGSGSTSNSGNDSGGGSGGGALGGAGVMMLFAAVRRLRKLRR